MTIPAAELSPGKSWGKRVAARWESIAPALRSRNFTLLWIGQLVSSTGTNLQTVAEFWLIYNLTHSTLVLGILGIVSLLPVVPISIAGSLLIDRVPRRKLIMVTQTGLMLQAAIFSLLVLTGMIRVWHIILLDFVLGALSAIDQPARQAFLTELVSSEDLSNAIALNSVTLNVSRMIGYATSGVLIATVGVGRTFLLNMATFIAPILALNLMRVKDVAQDTRGAKLKVAFIEGIDLLWRQPVLLGMLSLMAVVLGMTWPIYRMMPAFAQDQLNSGAVGLGLLMSANGVGALIGTVVVSRAGSRRRGHWLMVTSFLVPALAFAFALTGSLLAAFLVSLLLGLTMLTLQTLGTTLFQISVPGRVQGRAMSIFTLITAGAPRCVSVLMGGLAESFGLPLVLTIFAGIALVYALGLHIAMPSVRRLD